MCISLAMSGAVAAKTDIAGRMRLRSKKAPVEFTTNLDGKHEVKEGLHTRSAGEETIRAFITLNQDADQSLLEKAGVTVTSIRGDIALAEFPASLLETVENLSCVKSIRIETPIKQKMDLTRAAIGVDKIHAGDGLPKAFTGKGVITGIVDGGFDPNHINFLDADGDYRIKQLSIFRYAQSVTGQQQVEVAKMSGERLKLVDTDAYDSFHATHTTGIMAGGYKGKLKTGYAVDFIKGNTKEVENPYYGVAPDADIVAGAAEGGQLSDYFIALGCESILDYAYEKGQPVALNLSLGSNVGPHDGSSSICRYLDGIINDKQVNTIVCVAAGNEGDIPIAITKRCDAENNTVGSFLHPSVPMIQDSNGQTYKNPRTGLVYIYSDSEEPFEIQAQIYNKSRKTVTSRFPLVLSEDGTSYQYWVSSSEWQQDSSDKVDTQLSRYFQGYIGLASEIDPDANRYYAVIDFTLWDSTIMNDNGNYIIGFQVTGKDGQRIDIYGDGGMTYFSSEGINGYSDGGFNGTINDIATGKNTIIVGSYNTRNYWGSLDGNVYGYWENMPVGKISSYTSFGSLIDGREMPHICAPGSAIISSSSKAYLDAVKAGDTEIQARVAASGRFHDFHQCIGTSMAAPVVTGTIALWLEAYPQLTAAQARDILIRTAVKDEDVLSSGDPIQWGAGKLDAYEGLKEVLKLTSGINDVEAAGEPKLQIRKSGSASFDILMPGASVMDAVVYDLSGAAVLKASASGNEISVDASALMPGVYILKVNNASVKITIN